MFGRWFGRRALTRFHCDYSRDPSVRLKDDSGRDDANDVQCGGLSYESALGAVLDFVVPCHLNGFQLSFIRGFGIAGEIR